MTGSESTVYEVNKEIEDEFGLRLQIRDEPKIVNIAIVRDRYSLSRNEISKLFNLIEKVIKIEEIKELQFEDGVSVESLPLLVMDRMKKLEVFRITNLEEFNGIILRDKPSLTEILINAMRIGDEKEFVKLPSEMKDIVIGIDVRRSETATKLLKIILPVTIDKLHIDGFEISKAMIKRVKEINWFGYSSTKISDPENVLEKLENISDEVHKY